MKKIDGKFQGSIDDFLNHCAELDADAIERDVENEEQIIALMKESGEDRETVIHMLKEYQLQQIDEVIVGLMEKGLVEIDRYEDGEPVYKQTELGQAEYEKMKKDQGDLVEA